MQLKWKKSSGNIFCSFCELGQISQDNKDQEEDINWDWFLIAVSL